MVNFEQHNLIKLMLHSYSNSVASSNLNVKYKKKLFDDRYEAKLKILTL